MKNNKKKIIVVISVLAGVLVIGLTTWFVAKLISGGKQLINEMTNTSDEKDAAIDFGNKIDQIVDNLSSEEDTKATENETEAEPESETESQTEESTSDQINYDDVDWWAIFEQVSLAGNADDIDWSSISNILLYTSEPDENQREILLTEIKKADNYEHIDWDAESSLIGGIGGVVVGGGERETQTVAPTKPTKPTLELQLKMDKESYATGYYKEDGTIIYISRSLGDAVMNAKNEWIKNNFGTAFTFNGIDFAWDETNKTYYWVDKYGSIHYMTSVSTSMLGQYCRNSYSYRIADYLGFYGTDFALYKNEEALKDTIFVAGRNEITMTVDNPRNNNVAYLKQLGWTEVSEDDGINRHWSYESPKGVPASITEGGYISIYVKYPEDEKEKICNFTIEEYNELINNNTWRVSSRSGSSGLEGTDPESWQKYIRKYLIIE